MFETCVYAKRYDNEIFDTDLTRPFLTVYNDAIIPDVSTETFFETAIRASRENSVSVKIFERSDRMRAEFYFHRVTIPEENSLIWISVRDMSDMFSYTVSKDRPQIVTFSCIHITCIHIKREKLSEKP